jgi:hypothetical protein
MYYGAPYTSRYGLRYVDEGRELVVYSNDIAWLEEYGRKLRRQGHQILGVFKREERGTRSVWRKM